MLDGGRRVRCTWGRIGNTPAAKEFRFDDRSEAKTFMNRKFNEKLRKGYTEQAVVADDKPTKLARLVVASADVRTEPAEKKHGRIYFWMVDGEGQIDVMQEFGKRYGEHETDAKIWRLLIPHVLRRLGKPSDLPVSWSQYAGCTCPCSPGFIVRGLNVDVHVHIPRTKTTH